MPNGRPLSGGGMRSVVSERHRTRDDAGVKMPEIAGNGDSAKGCGRVRCKRAVCRPTNAPALEGERRKGGYKSGRPGGADRRDARRCGSPKRKLTPGRRQFPGEGTEHVFMRCCQGGNVQSVRIKTCSVSAAAAQCSSVRNRACGTVLPTGRVGPCRRAAASDWGNIGRCSGHRGWRD